MRGFVATAGRLVKPGGLVIASTINRTMKAFALAIVEVLVLGVKIKTLPGLAVAEPPHCGLPAPEF